MTATPSPLRRTFMLRLTGRCAILALCAALLALAPEQFDALRGMNFFRQPSALHLLWLLWMFNMIAQLMPGRPCAPLGSQKLFARRFRPAGLHFDAQALRRHIVETTKSAHLVMLLWTALTLLIGALHCAGVLTDEAVLLIVVFFYVSDLICVLIWCPFRLLMKNRCCTTCRIYNWDHIIMFAPMVFVRGFYGLSLFAMSVVDWLVWELSVALHPERFWVQRNEALRCRSCTDKLCTQYCQKLR